MAVASAPETAQGRASPGPSRLREAELLLLLALLLAVVALALEPLLSYPVFGSDSGEYYALSSSIAGSGHLPSDYLGWGRAYPDFPGTFVLAAALSGATGESVLSSLSIGVPVVAALSVLPLFLLFRRLFANDAVAILGAGLASVAFPRIFSLAHPAPLALGDLFAVAGLWMFVEGRTDVRWYLPLALVGGALVVTHHLSSYFFVVSALGSLLIAELAYPGIWGRRFPTRELAFLAAFLLALFAFWFEAPGFLLTVAPGAPSGGLAFAGAEALALVATALVGLLIRWRRARSGRPLRVRFPSDRSVVRDLALLAGGTVGGILLLLLVPLPGTSQTTTASAILFFAPILALVPLASGTRRLVSASRLGPFAIAWLTALGLSALAALATSDPVISPTRHAEYLVLPLALLAGLGIGRLTGRTADRFGRTAAVAVAVGALLLVAANASSAYPPPADLGGFQEGLTTADLALVDWAAVGLTPGGALVASDHRLSSMLFGFDGLNATWDSTPQLFEGSDPSMAAAELRGSSAPSSGTLEPVGAVAVDQTMRSGVALDPSALAGPMSPQALAWLGTAPFVPIYENGDQAVYWVDGPVGGTL